MNEVDHDGGSGRTRTPTSLLVAVRSVLRHAIETFSDDAETRIFLQRHLDRLDEPLRVAIAGKVKAGKSTLLNALVGERIAATDAGECTRVITWYRDGATPRITMQDREGVRTVLPVQRHNGALHIDLQGEKAENLDRLVVDWPSQHLRATTLIDTPGIGSLSKDVSARTLEFLTSDEDVPAEADAVVYLMRHMHATDIEFLEAFRDQGVVKATSVNALAVLSRADEVGAGRLDALLSARFIAQRYEKEPSIRALCQNVVAVAGLIAQTGRTLEQTEFAALEALAAAPREEIDALLLSADRFVRADVGIAPTVSGTVPEEQRRRLLDRLGIFGIRLATALIREGFDDSAKLSEELIRRSGLHELRRLLDTQFAQRRDLLKARSALLAVQAALRRETTADTDRLEAEVERITAGAHEFVELRLLTEIRAGVVEFPEEDRAEAERLLGGEGPAPESRLATESSEPEVIRKAAFEALERWQRRAESPLSSRQLADASRVVIRSCEGVLAGLPEQSSGGGQAQEAPVTEEIAPEA